MDVTAVVMGKLPAAGRVKTRLCPPLTYEQAADVHGLFLRHTLQRMSGRVDAEEFARAVFCFDPPEKAGEAYVEFSDIRSIAFLPQSEGDLGRRLVAVQDLIGREWPLLFLGADSPDVPEEHLSAAARAMEGHDVTLGPCDDGGFWCIGTAAGLDLRPVVAGVEWSSGRELAQTRANAVAAGFSVADAPAWSDVDRPGDLATLYARLARGDDPAARSFLDKLQNVAPRHLLPGDPP